jgi:hypothetical protein
MKKATRSRFKRSVALMSTGGRDWKLWELLSLILLVAVVVGVLMWSLSST